MTNIGKAIKVAEYLATQPAARCTIEFIQRLARPKQRPVQG